MAWLLYTRGLRCPSPRIIFDVDRAGNPIFGEAERGDGTVLARHRLTADEATLLRAGRIALTELTRRYPPPPWPDDGPAPVRPDPVSPTPTGSAAAKQMEAA